MPIKKFFVALGAAPAFPASSGYVYANLLTYCVVCLQGGCLLSVTLMLLARHDHVVLYLGTALFGMSLSSVAPTSISLAESYIDVTCTSRHARYVDYVIGLL